MKKALFLLLLVWMPLAVFGAPETDALVGFINGERNERNIPALTLESDLSEAAMLKAQSLAALGRLEHTQAVTGEPWWPLREVSYDYSLVGENLAVNIMDPGTLVSDWMSSPTHRANILNPRFQDVGIGIVTADFMGEPAAYVVLYTAEPAVSAQDEIVEEITKNTLRGGREDVEALMNKIISLLGELIKKTNAHA